MKYTFYESFEFRSNTSAMRTKTWLTNRVEVYTNPQKSLVERMISKYGNKYASLNKRTNKLYIRQRVRRATVKYYNRERFNSPEFGYSYTENFGLGIFLVKEQEEGSQISWRKDRAHEEYSKVIK